MFLQDPILRYICYIYIYVYFCYIYICVCLLCMYYMYILLICYSVSARPNVDISKYICMSCKNIMLASTSTPKLMTCVIQPWPNWPNWPARGDWIYATSFLRSGCSHSRLPWCGSHSRGAVAEGFSWCDRFEVKGSNGFFSPFNLGTKKQGPFTWGLLGNMLDSKNSCLEVIEVSIGESGS